MRTIVVAGSLAVTALCVTAGARSGPVVEGPGSTLRAFEAMPGANLPVLKTHEYVMAGAVRPLMFWIGRDDIGVGRIVWRADAHGSRGYELLVGTDPQRAPRGINRWGLISEEARGADGSVLAFMTGSHDTSYKAEAAAAGTGRGDYRAIQSRTAGGTAVWQLANLRTSDALTVRQSTEAIGYLRRDAARTSEFQRPVAGDVRPGFLVAVADLLDESLAIAARGGATPSHAVRYVFGSHTYDLRLRDGRRTTVPYEGAVLPAVRSRFETREIETGETTWFELTTATTGELSGVPLQIEWQPRWWLRVRLQLAAPPPR